MTKAELINILQTTTKNEFKKTNSEIAVAFPGEHEWFPGKNITNFDILKPWARELGWNVESEGPIDQTLQTLPDILFSR
ncbi:MAG: hypothetical protein IPQ16_11100 [Geobacteraceae bacterium]|nr:hypothetical protein [Geobacteraceae bacterium]